MVTCDGMHHAQGHQVSALRNQLAASDALARQQQQELGQACGLIQGLQAEQAGLKRHLIACLTTLTAKQAALQQLEARLSGDAPDLAPAQDPLADEVQLPLFVIGLVSRQPSSITSALHNVAGGARTPKAADAEGCAWRRGRVQTHGVSVGLLLLLLTLLAREHLWGLRLEGWWLLAGLP